MKIRTDFVTNSSSSSFIVFSMDLYFKNGKQKHWGDWCAYVEGINGSDTVDEYDVNFFYIHANISLKKLIKAKTVKEFTTLLYSGIEGESEDYYDPDTGDLGVGPLFKLEWDGLLWDEELYGGMDQLERIAIHDKEASDYGDGAIVTTVTYDFTTGKCTSDIQGDDFDIEDSSSGQFYVDTDGIPRDE